MCFVLGVSGCLYLSTWAALKRSAVSKLLTLWTLALPNGGKEKSIKFINRFTTSPVSSSKQIPKGRLGRPTTAERPPTRPTCSLELSHHTAESFSTARL